MCPRCRQNAPLVYRGVSAYCTACGAPRMPLANTSVTLAGQPSKVGGTVARVFGWLVLAGGWGVAAMFAGLLAIMGGTWAAAIVGGVIALIASIVAWALLRSGRTLKKSGDDAETATRNQAIFALASTRGGVLKAWDVAQMHQVTPQAADETLTRLAKEHPDWVTVDVDDEGNVLYRFPQIHWGGLASNVRVAPGADASVRVETREPLPREGEEELVGAEPARRNAR